MLPLLAATLLSAAPLPSSASFHFISIKEVFAGAPARPNAQYVVLQMYFPGQTFVAGKQIRVFDAAGAPAGTFTFTGNVANGNDQATLLIATPDAQAFFTSGGPLAADLAMTPVISALGGKVCFHDPTFPEDIDCVAWGGYTAASAGVGTPFNVPVGIPAGRAIRRRLDVCGSPSLLEQCDDTGSSANDFRTAAPEPRNNAGTVGAPPAPSCGDGDFQGLEQCDDGNLVSGDGCSGICEREPAVAVPHALLVDAPPPLEDAPLAEGNNVLEPGEEVEVAPAWRNAGTGQLPLSGRASFFTGPGGAAYNVTDPTSAYGTVAPNTSASCRSTGNCLLVSVSDPPARPATHWDATLAEVLSTDSARSWAIHVGRSFTDVPDTSGFYRFIETLLHRGVTGGCSATAYCPASPTTRAAMAVFVLVAKEGPAFAPPPCAPPNTFLDVPETSPFCRWIEELARRQVVGGCGGGNYCPDDPVTREQMAIFALRTLDPTLDPPACVPPNTFLDVPETSLFCRWIEELARRQVVGGCGGGNYCPTSPVTREQMGVFLTATFGLTLYGP